MSDDPIQPRDDLIECDKCGTVLTAAPWEDYLWCSGCSEPREVGDD